MFQLNRHFPGFQMEISKNGSEGVSKCYVFKSRLQEYAQKMCFPTPAYETTKEGPSHEPSFKSTVTLNHISYDSLPGFFNRKAAEQSAAEVALLELAKTGEVNQSISVPVHETGLCKNLLQEYAQKMNFAIPSYECTKVESPGRVAFFSCTVDIGGIKYIGASARTKKEAEIKAARTALLAIQSSSSEIAPRNAQLTVVPCKKRSIDANISAEPDKNLPKAKKRRFNKKKSGTKSLVAAGNHDVSTDALNLVVWPMLPYLPNAMQQPPVIPADQQPNTDSNNASRMQSSPKTDMPGFTLHPYITNVGQQPCVNPHNGTITQGPAPHSFPWLPQHPHIAHVGQWPGMIPPDHQLNMNSRTESSTSQLNSTGHPPLPDVVALPMVKSQDVPPLNANSSDGLRPG